MSAATKPRSDQSRRWLPTIRVSSLIKSYPFLRFGSLALIYLLIGELAALQDLPIYR